MNKIDTHDKPLVSVIIPTYKRPNMITRAVKSVQGQTYSNIEIIVVDDNGEGTDAQLLTSSALDEIKDSIVYLVHRVNLKGSAARNTGWRRAKGTYIIFLDDDDEMLPHRIEKQVDKLEELDDMWGACYTAYHIIKEDGTIQRSCSERVGNVYQQALMRTLYMGSGSNILLRKSAVDAVNGYDESFIRNQDIEFMARIFEKYNLAYVDEDLLAIHYEARQNKQTFEFSDEIDRFYLNKFSNRINALSNQDRMRVLNVISLERARMALGFGKRKEACAIIIENHVPLSAITKYISYIAKRVITKKSYGFYY